LPNYPNPTTGETMIQFQSPTTAPYQINVFDSSGKQLQSFDNQAISGLNQFPISLSQNGIYTYQIICQGENLLGKVVVLK
jgi:Secretion system C-terminal sorting domain